MAISQSVLPLVWFIASFAIALFLYQKYNFFKQIRAPLLLFLAFVVTALLHNFTYAIFSLVSDSQNPQELIFSFFALFLFGISINLFILHTFKALLKDKKKTLKQKIFGR